LALGMALHWAKADAYLGWAVMISPCQRLVLTN